ncbi:MAG TPA: universal stress protein [Pyrinomonadaceae bacterium]|nr:universal stress protein [Pyrinomonadaceae bacterium]
MKILIGYDGSDCSEAALDDLQKAGLPPVADALIMSVTEVWLPSPLSTDDIVEQAMEIEVPADMKRVYAKASIAVKEAEAMAAKARDRLRGAFPRWQIEIEASSGSPAWELVAKADQWEPDLIVVGSHGHSGIKRLVLGSVSQRVVTEARGSVRVARGRVEEHDNPVRNVIGIDGSPGSEIAVREVASRFWSAGSEVRFIAVMDPLTPTLLGRLIPSVSATIEDSNRADREWVEKILADAAAILKDTPVGVSTGVCEGDPKRALVEAAEAWGADCMFVGSTGFSNRLERFVLGSTSAAVIARAHCSVEVVRKPKQA